MGTANTQFRSIAQAGLLVAMCALWGAATLDGVAGLSQRRQEPAHQNQPPQNTTPQSKAFALTVTVVGRQGETAEATLPGATVSVFTADHEERHTTDTSGKATFRFTTASKAFTLRVVADKWQPYQQQLEIDGVEKAQKVLLKPSD